MSRLGWLLSGVVLGAGGMYAALGYHLLNTDEGFELVPKVSSTLSDTYLDVREFTISDWSSHEAVVRAIYKADKQGILKDAAGESFQQGLNGLFEQFKQ